MPADPELRARAVRLVRHHQQEYSSPTEAMAAVAEQLGVARESHNPPTSADAIRQTGGQGDEGVAVNVSDGVFLVGARALIEMPASPFDAEAELQRLLEEHPDLLAGGLIDPDEPRRWLLVNREQGVPAAEGAPDVWSVDHLFVDQDAVPTIVEVKRSTNTQIRRQVVGQMLDYAANGVRYWPPDKLRSELAVKLGGDGRMAEEISRLLDRPSVDQHDVEDFWRKFGENLRACKLRLLFVADQIPDSLQRIIEFLNDQMPHTEVLGLAIRQYAADGHQVLIPRIYGKTAAAAAAKGEIARPSYDELLHAAGTGTKNVVQRLEGLLLREGWTATTSRTARQLRAADGTTLLSIYPAWGGIQLYLGDIDDAGMRQEYDDLLTSLTALAGRTISRRNPIINFERLTSRWTEFESQWLPRYLEARQDARRTL